MIAEILATGDEIRNGSVVNTNSAFIAESLESIGVTVTRHHVAGDSLSELSDILKEIDLNFIQMF